MMNKTSQPPATEAGGKLYKMKDLAEATGVSGGTIRYYIQEGLLPRPIKTHRNMAYYDDSYVEKIKTIKELQQKRYLPLHVIKAVIEDYDDSGLTEIRRRIREEMPGISDVLFNATVSEEEIRPMGREELAAFSGLPLKDIDDGERGALLVRGETGLFDRESVQIARIAGGFRKIGLTSEMGFGFEVGVIYMDFLEFIARKEVEMFTRRIAALNLPPEGLAALIRKALDILNRLFPILHRRMLRRATREILERTL